MMFSRIREYFNPAIGVALLALVFAMTGGAFAMSSGGPSAKPAAAVGSRVSAKSIATTAKSKTKPKAKTGPRGPAGKNGAAGPPGATGPAGPAGPQGPAGTNGSNGEKGLQGEKGETGPQGPSGTTGYVNTLPPKASETGMWGFSAHAEGLLIEHFDFTIPLKKPLEAANIHLILPNGEEQEDAVNGNEPGAAIPQTVCTGSVEDPTAPPGNFCAYILTISPDNPPEYPSPGFFGTFGLSYGSGIIGTFDVIKAESEYGYFAYGSWAVTAPEESS